MQEDGSLFVFRGCRFLCTANISANALYLPRTQYLEGLPGIERFALPQDADAYGTHSEALRHAEQQAVRWVNDRIGDGQGQF